MKKVLLVAAVLVIAFLVIQWSRSDYRAFSERREDWRASRTSSVCQIERLDERLE